MMHPDTKLGFVNDVIGFGVFATKFIPKGSVTWVLDELDQKISASYVQALDPIRRQEVLKYSYRDRDGQYILCWDLGRYMNHSFSPNCMSTAYEFDLAVRDIYPGEQLTCDYGCLNVDEPFHCLPEPGSCRTSVMPDDILHYYREWDSLATEAMRWFNQVEQPLKPLLPAPLLPKLDAIAAGKAVLDSILLCHYDRDRRSTLLAS